MKWRLWFRSFLQKHQRDLEKSWSSKTENAAVSPEEEVVDFASELRELEELARKKRPIRSTPELVVNHEEKPPNTGNTVNKKTLRGISSTGSHKPRLRQSSSPQKITLKLEKKAHIVRQLSTLLGAGMDLRSSLTLLVEQENGHARVFLENTLAQIEGGSQLSEAIAHSGVIFDASEIAIIRAGEATGQQSETLAKMAALAEQKVFLKKKVLSALFYPATVLLVSSAIILLLTTFVIPKFETVIVDQVGPEAIPVLTAWILAGSRFITNHLLIVIVAFAVWMLAIVAMRKNTTFQRIFYDLLRHLPIFGRCLQKWYIVLFARVFGDLLLCGCSVVESLKMARASVSDTTMQHQLSLAISDVQQGISLAEALHRRHVLPEVAEGLIKVGEESGNLGEMMQKIATTYEAELNELMTRATVLIEPLLIVILAFFIGTIVIGLFLPLVSLIQNIAA
ncbi:MAG: type II secretion system F family protein [Opitutales bacterium]|nr:type II secretion system F family protein [Opitutales bacterium]